MKVFIDYANVEPMHRHKGIKYVVTSVLAKLGADSLRPVEKVDVRVYDGWYEGSLPTALCQRTSAAVQEEFPCPVAVPDEHSDAVRVVVNVELAYSLSIEPRRHLFHTYRRRACRGGVRCHHPRVVGCDAADCPMMAVYNVLTAGGCACGRKAEEFLFAGEQKLVDTMLTADIIHAVQTGVRRLVLVSADDDMWPAIRMALAMGARVTQIYTREPGQILAYASGADGNYDHVTW